MMNLSWVEKLSLGLIGLKNYLLSPRILHWCCPLVQGGRVPTFGLQPETSSPARFAFVARKKNGVIFYPCDR
jgi:hypothetical protein